MAKMIRKAGYEGSKKLFVGLVDIGDYEEKDIIEGKKEGYGYGYNDKDELVYTADVKTTKTTKKKKDGKVVKDKSGKAVTETTTKPEKKTFPVTILVEECDSVEEVECADGLKFAKAVNGSEETYIDLTSGEAYKVEEISVLGFNYTVLKNKNGFRVVHNDSPLKLSETYTKVKKVNDQLALLVTDDTHCTYVAKEGEAEPKVVTGVKLNGVDYGSGELNVRNDGALVLTKDGKTRVVKKEKREHTEKRKAEVAKRNEWIKKREGKTLEKPIEDLEEEVTREVVAISYKVKVKEEKEETAKGEGKEPPVRKYEIDERVVEDAKKVLDELAGYISEDKISEFLARVKEVATEEIVMDSEFYRAVLEMLDEVIAKKNTIIYKIYFKSQNLNEYLDELEEKRNALLDARETKLKSRARIMAGDLFVGKWEKHKKNSEKRKADRKKAAEEASKKAEKAKREAQERDIESARKRLKGESASSDETAGV